jgi:hypothetical protein
MNISYGGKKLKRLTGVLGWGLCFLLVTGVAFAGNGRGGGGNGYCLGSGQQDGQGAGRMQHCRNRIQDGSYAQYQARHGANADGTSSGNNGKQMGPGSGQGPNFTDKDGDGVCDNLTSKKP